ncbi:ECF transporter S component [Mycoplasma yeatsii]|uniref:ECF transporter S component (Folate family) n=2 Tax=Mycoplasma yeatsii TaxID=51365 RepID=A0ABU0NFR9_9MOLU|nr:ECF transporter S component [Mycoplasma yeatsii]AJM71604.1 membrane protein [Mycoplasma yeatsii GM274B]MDQ0568007.1 ECF transporter S component (folate family) [Mycoplasma yeatsii]
MEALNGFRELLLKSHNLAYFSLIVTVSAIFIYFIFQFSKRFIRNYKNGFVYNEKIKFNTKKITYISMMVAVSVSITTVISLTIPITVLPPIRIAFEGVMIKITGMIFGPIIGLIVGIVTEALTLMFVPSYIHIGYLVVAFSFGFWAGMTAYSFRLKNKWFTLSLITMFIVLSAAFMFWIMKGMQNLNPDNTRIFGIKVNPAVFPNLFLGMMGGTLALIYLVTFVLEIKKKDRWLNIILPIILLCIITEILVTVLSAAWADYQILTPGQIHDGSNGAENTYITMVVLRMIQVPVKLLFNTTILTTVYVVLRPLIKVR